MRWAVLFQSICEICEIGGQPDCRFWLHAQDDIRGSEAEVIRCGNRLDGVSPHREGLKLETEILGLPPPRLPVDGSGVLRRDGSRELAIDPER